MYQVGHWLRLVKSSQAHSVNTYKKLRTKVMKCCANIYFNRQCFNKKVIPIYADIKVAHTSPASNITSKKTHMIRIRDEIKFLYKKKEKLNSDLYRTHRPHKNGAVSGILFSTLYTNPLIKN